MRRTIGLLAECILMSSTLSSDAGILTGPIINPANGHLYYLLDQSNWTDAQAQATVLGGNLATARNAAENTWIAQTFGTFGGVNRNLWIGLNDVAIAGDFTWISGEPVTYVNWSEDGPNYIGLERWVYIISPAITSLMTWNNYYNGTSAPYTGYGQEWPSCPNHGIVEVVPEPATLTLLALGGLIMMRRRDP